MWKGTGLGNRNYSGLFFKIFLGGGALALLSIPLFIAGRVAASNALRRAPWKLLGRRGLDESQVVQGSKLYVPVGDNYYRDLREFRRINGWLSSQMADKLYREVIQSGEWKAVPEATGAGAPAQQPTAVVSTPQSEKPASKPNPTQTAKPWSPPAPAAKTELGDRLKQRFIEFDVNGSAEQLTPYFDEALAALRENGDDPYAFYWGCRTIHELLRLPMDAFRQRIDEVEAIGPVRDRVVQLQVDVIRYNEPDPRLNDIVAANLKALTGDEMAEETRDARRFNAAWIEFAGKAGKYPASMTESEREKFETEVCGICARLNSCTAVNNIVKLTVDIMRVLQQAEQFGHTVSVTRINLQTGEQETSRSATLYEAEAYGERMVAALPKEALEQCLAGKDFSIDPTGNNYNYYLYLKRAATQVGLIA